MTPVDNMIICKNCKAPWGCEDQRCCSSPSKSYDLELIYNQSKTVLGIQPAQIDLTLHSFEIEADDMIKILDRVRSAPQPPKVETLEEKIGRISRVAHEINRAYCVSLGDASPVPWEEASDAQRKSVADGVRLHLEWPNLTPEQSHENWMAYKKLEGWTYGEHKDEELRLHPCIKPYRELPREQRTKDYLFRAVVHTLM